mmetsp:Transcript_21043/g.38043  ORF Transcript_21043/g.38043 Transcript_21043/m.38043 type:complete len:590 (-) Transcript_21043:138-1907(-)
MTTDFLLDGSHFLGCAPPALPPILPIIAPVDINDTQAREPSLSRRQKAARGALAKIDSVYASVHALEIVSNLLNDACSYLQTVSHDLAKQGVDWKSLKLPCDCLKVAIDGLEQHGSIISQAIVNSSDTKEVKYAQSKLIKSQKKNYAQQLNHRGVMERDPKNVMTASLNYAKDTLDDILSKTNPDFITEKAAKKRKKSLEQSIADEQTEGATKKQKESDEGESKENIDVIDLPRPMDGSPLYSPLETVAYISNMIKNTPGNKSYIRAYKEKIMAEKLVPIQKSQLNALVKQYGGPDKPVAPLNWNERGAKEICWENLLTQFQAKQNRGGSWSIDDTRDVLSSAATENKKKAPTKQAIEAHHATLILLHKRQNHINEQIQTQERRLMERPPTKSVKKQDQKTLTRIRFDKNDTKYEGIKLPTPSAGNLIYTPTEAVTNIMNFIQSKPTPSRTDVRAFKEKMIAEKIVPISISQLNHLVQTHGGPDKESAPKCWNAKGREELISIEDLAKKVNDSQMMWGIENTCDAVWAQKREKFSKEGLGLEEVKRPDKKTVNAYHTALLSIPEIAHKVIKPEIIKLKPGPKVKNYLGA